jgi:hypothetical protein
MRRREFVQAIVAATVAAKGALGQKQSPTVAPSTPPPVPTAPGPLPWMRGLLNVKPFTATLVPDEVATTDTQFFSEEQFQTLRHLCEVMMPAYKHFPSAADASAPEFLDFLIGVSPEARQKMYKTGLDRLQSEAKKKFSSNFSQLSDAQADELLRPWLRTWVTDHPPKEAHALFINTVHSDIRTATINSQVWSEAEVAAGRTSPDVGLYWYPVDPDLRREGSAGMRGANPNK